MTDNEFLWYIVKIAIGLAIEIPILFWVLEVSPLGEWTPIAIALSLPVIGLAAALFQGWHKYEE